MKHRKKHFKLIFWPSMIIILTFVLLFIGTRRVFDWWGSKFWILYLIAFFFLLTLSSIIRNFLYKSRVEPDHATRHFSREFYEYSPSEDERAQTTFDREQEKFKQEERQFCSFCGAAIEAGSRFCPNCGETFKE